MSRRHQGRFKRDRGKGENTEMSSRGGSNPPTWLGELGKRERQMGRGLKTSRLTVSGFHSQRKLQTWQGPQKSFPSGHKHS